MRKVGSGKVDQFAVLRAIAIMDFATGGTRPTLRNCTSSKPTSVKRVFSVRIDQNLMWP